MDGAAPEITVEQPVTVCFFSGMYCKGRWTGYAFVSSMMKRLILATSSSLLFFALAAPADAGRRKRSEVPPPVVIDRTVFTPVVSGL